MTKKRWLITVGFLAILIIVGRTVYTQYIYLRYTPVPIVKTGNDVEAVWVRYRDLLSAIDAERATVRGFPPAINVEFEKIEELLRNFYMIRATNEPLGGHALIWEIFFVIDYQTAWVSIDRNRAIVYYHAPRRFRNGVDTRIYKIVDKDDFINRLEAIFFENYHIK